MDPTLDNDENDDGDVSRSRDGSPSPLRKEADTSKKTRTPQTEAESDADGEDESEDVGEQYEDEQTQENDVFDGYSFKGRASVIIDDEEALDGVERSSESEEEGEGEDGFTTAVKEAIPEESVPEESVLDALAAAITTPVPNDTSRPEPILEEAEVQEGLGIQEVQATPISLKPSLGHSVTSEVALIQEAERTPVVQHADADEVKSNLVSSETSVTHIDVTDIVPPASSPLTRPMSIFVEGLSENDLAARAEQNETPAPTVPSKDTPLPSTSPTPVSPTTAVVAPAVIPVSKPVSAPLPKTAMRQNTTNAAPSIVGTAPPKPAKTVTIAPPTRGSKQASALSKSAPAATSKPPLGMSDDEDDDWDFVETPGGEDRNGTRGNNLFARGVVDRYRLAVFRKSSSSGGAGGHPSGQGQRVASSASRSSAVAEPSDIGSPESSEKRRGRGRLGKGTRTFLRARSPPAPPPMPAPPTPTHVVSSSGVPTLGSLGLSSRSSQPRPTKTGDGHSSLSGKRSASGATGSSGSAFGASTNSTNDVGTGNADTSSTSIAGTTTNTASTMTTILNAGPSLKSKDSSMSMSPSGISGSGSSSVDADGELGMNSANSGTVGTTYTQTTTAMSVSTGTSGAQTHDASRMFSLSARHLESGYLSSGETSTGGGGLFGIGKRNNTSSVIPMSPTGEEGSKKKKMKKYKEGAEKVLSLFGSPRQDKEKERERIAAEREKIQTRLLLQQKQSLQQQSTDSTPTPTPTQKQPHPVQTPPSPIHLTQTPVEAQSEQVTQAQSVP